MKPPTLLALLVLFAPLPAVAFLPERPPKPVERCNTEWLEEMQEMLSNNGGGIVDPDPRIVHTEGVLALKITRETCELATWRHLFKDEELAVLRNPAVGKLWWGAPLAQQMRLLLVVDDFFAAFDPKAAEVLAAADAVIEVGVELGVITTADTAKTLGQLLPGLSGGRFGALNPKTVTPVEAANQTANIPPEKLVPTLRKLLDETGEVKGGGEAVMRFRLAVMALNAEIGRLGGSNDAVVKRAGAAIPGVNDFTPGLPKEYVLPKVGKAAALDDVQFGAALSALIGSGVTPALDDAAPRAGSLLEPADLGVRNLVAIRAAQVEQIVALAKARLKGKRVSDFETAAQRAARAGKEAPANPLAAAVFKALSQTPEYAQLDKMYDENLAKKGGQDWAKTEEGKAMFAAREEMKTAALGAKVETGTDGRKTVVFTQGGKKRVLDASYVPAVDADPAALDNAAARIADAILGGTLVDAKYKAVVAAIGGAAQPGLPLDTGLKGPEVPASKEVPPATKKIEEGAAGCKNPKDLVRNDYEKYAARRRAAAVEMAGANVRSRADVEKKRLEGLAVADAACRKKKDELAAVKPGYFPDPAAKAAREKAAASAETACAADRQAVEEAARAKAAQLAALETAGRDPVKLRAEADADLAAAFSVAIAASVETLRKEYTEAGNSRRAPLDEITADDPKLTDYIAKWFDREWPRDPSKKKGLEASIAGCAKALGLGDDANSPSYHNPDEPDNVDEHCKVNKKLTNFIIGSKDKP